MKSLSRSPSLYGNVLALAALSATPALAQSEGTKCQSLTDCDEGLTCVYGNVAPGNPGTTTEPGMASGTGSTPVGGMVAGSGVSAAPVAPLPPESTGGASGTGEDPVPEEPPVDGLVAPPPPDDGTDPVAEIGVCTALPDSCTSDEQCDEGYYCSIAIASAPSVTCAPNEQCTEVPVSDPAINVGTCLISPLECSDAEPCPEATTCENGYCTYQPTECTGDDACDAGYSCTVTSSYQECSACPGTGTGMTAPGSGPTPPTTGTGTAPAGVAAAGAGSSAEAPPPDGADRIAVPPEDGGGATAPEPCTNVCTTVETRTCQPTPDACETDEDCDGEWVCYDVPEAALATMTWAGIAKTCLPLGIVAALEGSVQGSYSVALAGETTAVAGGTPGMVGPGVPVDENGNGTGAPVPMNTMGQAGAATSTATGTVNAPTTAPPSGPAPGDASTPAEGANPVRAARGCAVASTTAPNGSATGGSLLAALALAVGLLRRRRTS